MNRSKSRLFLIELMIDIVFFALTAAVCLSVFAKAHTLSEGSKEKNKAIICVQKAAEAVKAKGRDGIIENLKAKTIGADSYVVYYDKNFVPSEQFSEDGYQLIINLTEDGKMLSANVRMDREKSSIYEIEVKKYGS